MTLGIIYQNIHLYRAAMRVLYGKSYADKYQAVVDLIPAGATVVDLCCGDCVIAPMLALKGCRYTGLDINPKFVQWACEQGFDVRLWSGETDAIPAADIVCMQSSLYHFIPGEEKLLQRMMAASRLATIVSEPIHNLTTGKSALLSRFSRWLTRVNGKEFTERFSSQSFMALVSKVGGQRAVVTTKGRDMLAYIPTRGSLHGS